MAEYLHLNKTINRVNYHTLQRRSSASTLHYLTINLLGGDFLFQNGMRCRGRRHVRACRAYQRTTT